MRKFTYLKMILKDFLHNLTFMKIGKFAYVSIIRDPLKKFIDDPDKKIDDYVISALDEIFEYKEK